MKKTKTPISRPDGRALIAQAKLVRIPNQTNKRRYLVEFTIPEFTCLCPVTGFPDFATLYIRYVPNQWIVELKSLKLYINQFRDRGIYHETLAGLLVEELVQLLSPHELEVIADFNVRGNIKTIIRATSPDQLSSLKSSLILETSRSGAVAYSKILPHGVL